MQTSESVRPDGFRQQAMLLFEDSGGQGRDIIVGQNGNCGLRDDRPAIDVLSDEVYRAARNLDAVLQGLGLGVQAFPERRQQ